MHISIAAANKVPHHCSFSATGPTIDAMYHCRYDAVYKFFTALEEIFIPVPAQSLCLHVSSPANEFALEEAATASVFVAGGIGITPMLSMIRRLNQLGRPWQLHYSARVKEQMAFAGLVQELASSGQGEVHFLSSGDDFGGPEAGSARRG